MSLSKAARVRLAHVGDVPALVDLMEDVAGEGRWIAREAPLDRPSASARFTKTIEDPQRLSLVATIDERLVGSLGLVPDLAGHLDLGMMLAADARGRGLGSALLVKAIEWAREQPGIHKVTLQHWPWNTAAHALYRRHGFVVEGYLHDHWRRSNGELWDAVLMGLLLSET